MESKQEEDIQSQLKLIEALCRKIIHELTEESTMKKDRRGIRRQIRGA